MKTSHLSKIATIVAFASSSLLCHAQEADEVSLYFVSFPKSENTQPIELVVGENKSLSVELPTNSLSPVYKVSRNPKWALGKTVVDGEGESSFTIYGETPSIDSKTQLILVMRSGVEDKDGLKLIAIDYEPSVFKGGSYLFINSSKINITGKIGDSEFEVTPANHTLVEPKPEPKPEDQEDNKSRPLIHIQLNHGDDESPFYSSSWRFSEKARSMIFLYNEPQNQNLRIHTIRDYLP